MKPICEGAKDVRSACADAGIKLRVVEGDPGHPFCCKQRMQTKGGLVGIDYAKCHVCGKKLYNMLSPHVNGGLAFDVPEEDSQKDLADLPTWIVEYPKIIAEAVSPL